MITPGHSVIDRPLRVLIVDDERHNRQLLLVMLAAEGLTLQTAASGEEALAIVAAQAIDLVLLDIMMPGMDGHQVAGAIKANPLTKNIPVIMVTALDDHDTKMLALKAGAEDFLTKPVDRIELCLRVRNLLRLKAYGDYYDHYSHQLEAEVSSRTAALVESERLHRSTFDAAPVGMAHVGLDGQWLRVNQRLCHLLGYSSEELQSAAVQPLMLSEEVAREAEALRQMAAGVLDDHVVDEKEYRRRDGRGVWARVNLSVHRDGDGRAQYFIAVIEDITERRTLEAQIRQAQKLEAVGRLAAGVAHEINTPIQFISDSVQFVREAMQDLAALVGQYRALHAAIVRGEPSEDAVAAVIQAEHDGDVDYLLENVPRAIDRTLDGINRVAVIVRSMKEFVHPDQHEMISVDLNQAITSTLIIARNEYKYVADVETDFGDIPPVICHGGDINQVILNLVINAAHAIESVVKGTDHRGRITIQTRHDGETVVIRITDTGCGIPEANREQIFDPFFSTKEVGKGTGQGLAIVRAVVQEKHRGAIGFDTTIGVGTTFTVRLPIAGRGLAAA